MAVTYKAIARRILETWYTDATVKLLKKKLNLRRQKGRK